jgi:hypothetical protein
MFRIVELYVRKPLKDLLNPCANIIRAVEPGPANIRAGSELHNAIRRHRRQDR